MENKKPYILVVEDVAFASKIAKSILVELDCLVDIAETGEQALDMVKQKKYALIFMDIGLPKADGITTTEKIKQMEGMEDIPVIALTAHAEDEVREKCFKVGMVDFIVKPLVKEKADHVLKKYIFAKG